MKKYFLSSLILVFGLMAHAAFDPATGQYVSDDTENAREQARIEANTHVERLNAQGYLVDGNGDVIKKTQQEAFSVCRQHNKALPTLRQSFERGEVITEAAYSRHVEEFGYNDSSVQQFDVKNPGNVSDTIYIDMMRGENRYPGGFYQGDAVWTSSSAGYSDQGMAYSSGDAQALPMDTKLQVRCK